MNCPRCGSVIQEGAAFCGSCGLSFRTAPIAPPGASVPARAGNARGEATGAKQGLAIASLVLGIASFPLMCAFGLGILTALIGLVLGIVALVKANNAPQEYGGKGLAIGGMIASGVSFLAIPIIAAIAIPSLLRARVSANEAGTIGDIRTVISGEAAYQSANGGFYDKPECLSAPSNCIPGYDGPTFLDPTFASASVRLGYSRTFHPGPPPPPGATRVSGSSVLSFAYVAVPVTRNTTGVRAFCGDSSGVICYTSDGSAPTVDANGNCGGCQPLQ